MSRLIDKKIKHYIMGDSREREGFLFFPKKIDDEWRWWCRAKWLDVYVASSYVHGSFWYSFKWIDNEH